MSTSATVCPSAMLTPDRGVCALVDGRAVAIFRLAATGELHAIDNLDPISGASVLSRGLVGSTLADGRWTAYVASPLRKHRFDLRTGECLDAPGVAVDTYEVTESGGAVMVSPRESSSWGNGRETRP